MQYLTFSDLCHLAQCPEDPPVMLQKARSPSVSWLTDIPSYIHFAYPLICGPLGCFCVLVTVTNAAVTVGVQIPLPDPACSSCRHIQEVDLLDHAATLFLALGGLPHCSPYQLCHFSFPSAGHRAQVSPCACQHLCSGFVFLFFFESYPS